MSEDLDIEINDYLARVLLRYFRNAITVDVEHPDVDADQDLDFLRLHWAISKPVRDLVAHLQENAHQVQAVLETHPREDDARVRGRFDARATAIRRMVTGRPTLIVSHEPLRTYDSGPNHVLTWVLEQAWRLTMRFQDMLPEGASYIEALETCAPGLETIRRFDAIHQASKHLNLTRRPSAQAAKEASRSRRPIYVLAYKAYSALQAIEAGDEASISNLLNDTLLGPLDAWQRFELTVGLGLARALSKALVRPMALGFLGGGGEPIATIGAYEVHWQSRPGPWKEPTPEPSEKIVSRLLRQYGVPEGKETVRPDLVVLNRDADEVVAIVEVKYFASLETTGQALLRGAINRALREAINQLVRYARGYREIDKMDGLLGHSVAALVRTEADWSPETMPHGLPLVVSFKEITDLKLESWARRLISQNALAAAS